MLKHLIPRFHAKRMTDHSRGCHHLYMSSLALMCLKQILLASLPCWVNQVTFIIEYEQFTVFRPVQLVYLMSYTKIPPNELILISSSLSASLSRWIDHVILVDSCNLTAGFKNVYLVILVSLVEIP